MAFAILLGIICAPICYAIAKSKGRDPGIWALMGFLFSIFAVIVIALLGRPQPQQVVFSGQLPGTPATPATPAAPAPQQLSVADEIARWKQLHDDGAITAEEYAAKKQELLSRS